MPSQPKPRIRQFGPPSYGGVIGALVFWGFSLTPSLLPRNAIYQGLVSGLSLVVGYGLGALLFWAGRRALSWRPTERGRRIAWIALVVAGVAFVVPWCYVGGVWNNQTLRLMTLPPGSAWSPVKSLPLALVVWFVILMLARLLRRLARVIGNLLGRWLPNGASVVLGFGHRRHPRAHPLQRAAHPGLQLSRTASTARPTTRRRRA